ncbi:P-type cation-transporting ATPase [Endocarpon pusillum Z07020]|uniref:P-type cation-transporting ATPase n=1 Tax=Endocarpon pusillum (strain Z07020 / HMAS-L-300199) TaxID=1263415 RepID=U1HKL2_ENDPU|nr:P-type cation-transporting ATPase [Endocarpon pusillum Z07020]ERF70780.1 P-type cation-transporting ATPase [Endocarpon pusillum Z07020]
MAACCGGTPHAGRDRCTSNTSSSPHRPYLQKSCCSKEEDIHAETSSCDTNKSCLQDVWRIDSDHQEEYIRLDSKDIESATTIIEHVTLNVEGLTCAGCENKLFRSLDAILGVHNVQTSLVMSQAEFDLDSAAGSVDKIIQYIAKTTGFTCHRISTHGQSLDIRVSGDARDFINRKRPLGVESLLALNKQTVRITYNAKFVGARDLLDYLFDQPINLAPPRLHPEVESGIKQVRRAAFMTALSTMLTIPVLILAWAPLPEHEVLYGAISLILATVVQIVVAGPFYPSAIKALLFTRVIEMDLLVVLSTSAAYIFSVIAFGYQVRGRPLSTHAFFETSTLLVTLIMLGRLVSAFARHKAVESISIRSLQIGTALLVDSDGRGGQKIDARMLQYGDTFKVIPDARIPTDGIVVSGESEVDESNVTGEVIPVEKSPGSSIVAGSVNGSGTLIVRLTRLPGENTISEIAAMVDAAKFSKPKIQELADRVASFLVPVIVVLSLIAFVIWIAVGKAIQHRSTGSAAVNAMTYAISVLIVSCPCAIGLAVPMVVVIAGGVAAKHGVVFKTAETMEIARKVSHVVFDKTGTLTKGELSVLAEDHFSESQSVAASIALGLTMNSKHPVSAALAAHLQARGVEPVLIENMKSVTGSGMEGTLNGVSVRGGNSRWLDVRGVPRVTSLLSQGLTVFCISLDGDLLSVYGLDDSLRPDAMSIVAELQRRDIAVSLVSGDDDGAVRKIGHQLGISPLQVRSRYSARDKQRYVKAIMDHKDGEKVVLFCGDGTNDAVALAQANIGLHMNSGTDVAQSAADAVLVRPALFGIIILIDLSQAAFRRIIFNFSWSFVYNTFAILLAAGAFVNVRIPPQYAGLGELFSVLPVILIALQLRWFKRS